MRTPRRNKLPLSTLTLRTKSALRFSVTESGRRGEEETSECVFVCTTLSFPPLDKGRSVRLWGCVRLRGEEQRGGTAQRRQDRGESVAVAVAMVTYFSAGEPGAAQSYRSHILQPTGAGAV